MPLNLPNLLTWLRILFIPLMVGVFYLPDGWVTPREGSAGRVAHRGGPCNFLAYRRPSPAQYAQLLGNQ